MECLLYHQTKINPLIECSHTIVRRNKRGCTNQWKWGVHFNVGILIGQRSGLDYQSHATRYQFLGKRFFERQVNRHKHLSTTNYIIISSFFNRSLPSFNQIFYTWENPAGPKKILWEDRKKKEIEDDLKKVGYYIHDLSKPSSFYLNPSRTIWVHLKSPESTRNYFTYRSLTVRKEYFCSRPI